ncbi:MAG: glycosyltransferase family 4 protein [Prolixibacteraceae bacterium]
MRILQLANKAPWPPKDGEAIAILTLSKGFFLHGHRVTVLAMNTEEHHLEHDELPEHLAAEIDFRLIDIPGKKSLGKVLQNFFLSDLPFHAERCISDSYSQALVRLLGEQKFDVIQLEGLYLCPYIPLIRKCSDALIAYRAHNIEHEIWQHTAQLAGIWRFFYLSGLVRRLKRFELSFLNKYDVLVSITERDGLILDRLGNRKPRHTSETGIDLSSLVPTAKNLEYPSLFHIGALDWPPSQEGLIWFLNNCWPAIHEKHPELKFYIAGRNVPAWIETRFKSEHIIFLGEVEDAYHFMNSKAVMVVPLHSGSGIRIKIIEGMALGKAIVSTSIGCEGIPAIDRENILIANKPDDFIAAIEALVSDRSLFDRLCKNSVDFIRERFDNLAIVGSLIEFYQQQLAASGRPGSGVNS